MNNAYSSYKILENHKIATDTFEMKVSVEKQIFPGQFFMLRLKNSSYPLLSRPISVCDYDDKILTFLYITKGEGTKNFSILKPNDYIDLLGPLGNGFDINKKGKIALVGGGIGIAPLYYLAKQLKPQSTIDTYLGFRDESYYTDEFKKVSDNLYLYSDSGKVGKKGFVTMDIDTKNYDYIYSCGPTPMMNSLYRICNKKENVYFSLEKNMACGIGACLGCSIKTVSGMKAVCHDGPVFNGAEFLEGIC